MRFELKRQNVDGEAACDFQTFIVDGSHSQHVVVWMWLEHRQILLNQV